MYKIEKRYPTGIAERYPTGIADKPYRIEKRYQMWSSSGLAWSKWFIMWNISRFDAETEAKAKIKELPKRLCEKSTTYPDRLKNEYRIVKVD